MLLDARVGLSSAPRGAVPSATDMITASLRDPHARHLMLIVRGNAATCLLSIPKVRAALHDPVVMLASRFKEDQGEEHNYDQLSRIIMHMHVGRQVIIQGHDAIYGALYDCLTASIRTTANVPRATRCCATAASRSATRRSTATSTSASSSS